MYLYAFPVRLLMGMSLPDRQRRKGPRRLSWKKMWRCRKDIHGDPRGEIRDLLWQRCLRLILDIRPRSLTTIGITGTEGKDNDHVYDPAGAGTCGTANRTDRNH